MTDLPFKAAQILDDYVEMIEEPREPDGLYHPSSFWFCLRKTIYEVRGELKTNLADAESKRRFRVGHLIHELVQSSFRFSSEVVNVYPEFLVQVDDLRLKGHGDILVEMRDGSWIVVEIKSIRKGAFKFLKGGPKEEHKKQAGTYTAIVRTRGCWVDILAEGEPVGMKFIEPLGDKLKGVLFFYVEKEDLDTDEFFVEYDPVWEHQLKNKVAVAEVYRNDPASLPPRLPKEKGKLPWQCNPKWCEWYTRCMGDPDQVKPGTVEVEHW